MNQSYPGGGTVQDRSRLAESAARVDPDNVDTQHRRVLAYNDEALALYNLKASHTSVKMLDLVMPWVSEATMKVPDRLETMQWAAWLISYHSIALGIVGRGDDAVAAVKNQLDHFDPRWDKADVLRSNSFHVLNDRMLELMAAKDYEGALRVVTGHLDGCRADRWCGSNVSVVYRNWSGEKQDVGDWPAAREILRQCLATLPGDAECTSRLADLESRHRF